LAWCSHNSTCDDIGLSFFCASDLSQPALNQFNDTEALAKEIN